MKDKILDNLDKTNKNRYEEISILLESEKKSYDYFKDNYLKIMNKWKSKYKEFDIPNIFITISIDGNNNYYSNSDKLSNKTIFDLASISKIYTEMILFSVIEEYNLHLNTKICELTTLYSNISDLSLMDLISFNNTYKTQFDIRECNNKEDALKALRTVYIVQEKKNQYLYTDLPLMILSDILELYTNCTYEELFNKYIVLKYNLSETYLRIDSDNYLTNNKNSVNDPKAIIMGGFHGHCGVKATSSDLIKFLYNIFDSKYFDLFISKSKTIDENGNIKESKGLIGNSNLNVLNEDSLASVFLPSIGFAIQGSVRCHEELCKFKIDNKSYNIVTCIFTDLYTQVDNIKKYENNTGDIISKIVNVDNKKYFSADIRKIFSYKAEYKEIVNLVSKMMIIDFYKYINSK